MPQLALFLFGTPTIELDGVPVYFATRKTQAILIYLIITRQPQSREMLMLLLWPAADTLRGRASLRRALADIKKVIGENWLTTEGDIVALNEEADIQVDVWEYRQLITAVHSDPKTTYSQALSLYQADFLAGFGLRDSPAFDEWQFFEQEGLRQSFLQVLESLITWHREAEEWEAAITCSRRYVALDPLHEPAHVKLMQLYAESGQQMAALHQYEVCQRILEEELGIEPATTTTTLYHQIRNHRFYQPTLPPLELPVLAKTENEHNLPSAANAFVGREEELLQISALLDNPQVHLLTLVGLGGIGKTRLALEVSQRQIGRFAHGVWYVPLETVQSARELVIAIADTFNLPLLSNDDPQEQLVHYVRNKEMFWLLDNFEHLLDHTSLLSTVLSQSPALKIVVTSREVLDLAEEWLFQVEGLPFPSDMPTGTSPEQLALPALTFGRFGAVQLFTQRALQTRHTFSLAAEQAHVLAICQLVEGMPLALELAAAWIRMLPCAQIVSEIQGNLDFLTKTRQDVPDRHRSIRAVFETSWHRLSEAEQQLLAQLSIFRSSFTAKAALTVAEASLFSLYGLVNKSLVQVVGDGRYKLHELLRQFATEKLRQLWPQPDPIHERHARYFHSLLQQNQDKLFGPQQTDILNNIHQDIENGYQAWLWAAENGRITDLSQSFSTLYQYHAMRSLYQQGEYIFDQTLHLLEPFLGITDQETITLLARLTVYRGEYLYALGKTSEAENTLRLALTFTQQMHLTNEHELAVQTLGIIAYHQGRYAQANQFLTEALELTATINDPTRQAHILMTMGAVELALGNYADAQSCFQTSLAIFTEQGHEWGKANTLRFIGMVAHRQGNFDQAQAAHQESLTIYRTLNFETGAALALNNLGLIEEALQQSERAYQLYQQAFAVSQSSHTRWARAAALQNLGRISLTLGQRQQGRQYLRQGLELAAKAEALPLVLDIMLDIAHQLEATGKEQQAAAIAAAIVQHPASNQVTQQKASQLQAQLLPVTSPPMNIIAANSLQEQVRVILNLLT
jgi:DNA-binding SARP family transcriptional activator/predicted ATPase